MEKYQGVDSFSWGGFCVEAALIFGGHVCLAAGSDLILPWVDPLYFSSKYLGGSGKLSDQSFDQNILNLIIFDMPPGTGFTEM
jgi:hypothetical protein